MIEPLKGLCIRLFQGVAAIILWAVFQKLTIGYEIFRRFSHDPGNCRSQPVLRAILTFSLVVLYSHAAIALDSWQKLDRRLKGHVFQLNVGLKIRLKDGLWADLADLSPKYRFPVFSTTKEDKGYRVVGFGSSFPIKTYQTQKTYFLTSRHVVDSSDQIIKECERFYAAMRLYAEKTASGQDVDKRYRDLLQTVNLSTRKELLPAERELLRTGGLCDYKSPLLPPERKLYQQTVDAVWDTYESYLSLRSDPGRLLFRKYCLLGGVTSEVGYFLHPPGPATQVPLKATLYKVASSDTEPDLAVLMVSSPLVPCLELERESPSEGQEIQVIGYPTASDQIDSDSSKYYAPTFSTGRISRVVSRTLQVDAPITTGNSGGPVVNQKGKVLGVVAVRAISAKGGELPNFAGAIAVRSIIAFAPELFRRPER